MIKARRGIRQWLRHLRAAVIAFIVAGCAAASTVEAYGGEATPEPPEASQIDAQVSRLKEDGIAAYDAGHYAEAESTLLALIDLLTREARGDDPDTTRSYDFLGLLLEKQGRYAEAQAWFARSLELCRRVLGEDSAETARSYGNVARILDFRGRYAEAEPLFAKALNIRRRVLGDQHPDTADSFDEMAFNLEAQGHNAAVAVLHEEALGIRRRALGENHPDTARSYDTVAYSLDLQGRYAEAAPLYEKALHIRRQVLGERDPDTASSYEHIAFNLEVQDRPAEATPLYRSALDIRRNSQGEFHRDTADTYDHLAGNLDTLGQHAEAAGLLKRSLEIRRRLMGDQHPDTAASHYRLARNLETQGRDRAARKSYETALAIRRRTLGEDHPDTASSYKHLARNLSGQELHAEAVPLYASALAIRRRVLGESHPATAAAYEDAGANLLEIDATPEALEDIRAAALIRRKWRSQILSTRLLSQAQQMRDARAIAEGFLLLADADWQKSQEAPGELAELRVEAFSALQESIVSSAGAAVAQLALRTGNGDDALGRLARRRQDLELEQEANDAALLKALAGSGAVEREREETLHTNAARILREQDAIESEIKASFPSYSDLVSPEAVDVASLQALLRPGEAMLVIAPGTRGTHVFAVSPRQIGWTRSELTAQTVAQAVTELRCGLDASHCPRLMRSVAQPGSGTRGARRTGLASGEPTPHASSGFNRWSAYYLYRAIVRPVESVLEGASIVYVVTSGALTSLPFSVLVTEPPGIRDDAGDPDAMRRTPWLLRKFALTTLPSVASLKALRTFERQAPSAASGAARSDIPMEFIGFGDPEFGAGGPGEQGGTVPVNDLAPTPNADGIRLADPSALRSLGALPGTRAELEGMRAAFAPLAEIHLGADATETAVKASHYDGVRVVAFSTHGLVADDVAGVREPGLVLTPPRVPTAEDDGFLTASEVTGLRLGADWVILSACNTASSDGTPGSEALSGLARAFFYAGARSLLVSHWPVRDDVAARLTVDAIRRERADPSLGRARALQLATLAIIDSLDSPGFAQPSAWAPFVLVGEGQ